MPPKAKKSGVGYGWGLTEHERKAQKTAAGRERMRTQCAAKRKAEEAAAKHEDTLSCGGRAEATGSYSGGAHNGRGRHQSEQEPLGALHEQAWKT